MMLNVVKRRWTVCVVGAFALWGCVSLLLWIVPFFDTAETPWDAVGIVLLCSLWGLIVGSWWVLIQGMWLRGTLKKLKERA